MFQSPIWSCTFRLWTKILYACQLPPCILCTCHHTRHPKIWKTIQIILMLLTYLLTPCSRVLLEKLTGSAASQEIPCIFGTRRFITVLTSARHCPYPHALYYSIFPNFCCFPLPVSIYYPSHHGLKHPPILCFPFHHRLKFYSYLQA